MRTYAIVFLFILVSCKEQREVYVCTPCNLACDELTFSEAGECPHCKMGLIKWKESVSEKKLAVNTIAIQEGSGVFSIEGGYGKEHKLLKIYYHKPINYKANTKVLMVVPGAGRNADSYRNSWVAASEKYNVLILSPMYAEEEYDYAAYHMGNLIYDLNLEESVVYDEHSNNVFLDEGLFSFKVNPNQKEWIFNDFDRLFDLVAKELGSAETEYDIFGHSAGGQILHRFVIFQPNSKADRILAANSGSYTVPDFEVDLPFGLNKAALSEEDLKTSFKSNLTLFIGELDNENENGGLLLRSQSADNQGLHRLARGRHFYESSQSLAKERDFDFNWKLKIVPGIGHNQKEMAKAAAEYLYE